MIYYLVLTNLAAQQLRFGYQESPRTKTIINQGWKFLLGSPSAKPYVKGFDDSNWKSVHLPHTLQLASLNLNDVEDDKTQESFHRNVGWYRKELYIDDSSDKVFLEFEGAHQVTELWVNGEHVGQHSIGGYTPFHFDISEVVRRNSINQITLKVDNRKREDVPPDPGPFDYVKFGGLYRDVYLVETNQVRVTFNWEAKEAGVRFTTPSVDPINMNATLDIKTVVRNEGKEDRMLTVVSRIINDANLVVHRMEESKKIEGGAESRFDHIGAIEDGLRLWSIDDPFLYRLHTSVYEGNKLLDAIECKVGIRKFEQHPREGFLLNGEPIELIGANRHQHYGYIGDAMPNSLHRKDMQQFKQLGFNVVRTAHYPQDNALIEACDELGILVYEEAPTWIGIGNKAWFDNLEKAARVMVRNHRNHPSVVIWGGGINHRGYVPQVHLAVKQEDPTRLTASQSSRWTGWQTSGLTDVYGQMIYGPVEWYRHEPMLGMEGPESVEMIAIQKLDPMQTGLIAWNAHDYYTFHPSQGRWPQKVRPGGIMTIFRHPYNITNWYPAELTREPYLHIESNWTESCNEVVVYSNADEVELLVNGKNYGKLLPDRSGIYRALDHPPFVFKNIAYEPGSITVRAWIGSHLMAERTKKSIGKAHAVILKVDDQGRELAADGSDILQAFAYVVDEQGSIVPDAAHDIKFSIKGPAKIVGDGVELGANPVKLSMGHAPVLVRASTTSGKVTLIASSDGLKPAKASFTSVNFSDEIPVTEKYWDTERTAIDIGELNQLVQFGWEAWSEADNTLHSTRQFDALCGFSGQLGPVTDEGVMRWLGEMNVMGKNGYSIGEGVLCFDTKGLKLSLDDLKEGYYELKTYHHAPRSNTDSMDPNKDKLKFTNVTSLPYAQRIALKAKDINGVQGGVINISNGKSLDAKGAASFVVGLQTDGNQQVEVTFTSLEKDKGVWFNAFELTRVYR